MAPPPDDETPGPSGYKTGKGRNKVSRKGKRNTSDFVTADEITSDVKTIATRDAASTKPETIASGPPEAAGGIKNSFHGYIYQVKLLMLFLFRSLKLEEEKEKYFYPTEFELTTELKDAAALEDIVLKCKTETGDVYRFLQAKSSRVIKEIKLVDLENDDNGNFSVVKYFFSYCEVLQHECFKNAQLKDIIICTNIGLDEVVKGQMESIDFSQDKILNFKNYDVTPEQYKFKEGTELYKNIKIKLKNSNDDTLAVKLAEIYCNKDLNRRGKKLLKDNYAWLIESVFNENKIDHTLKFKSKFLTDRELPFNKKFHNTVDQLKLCMFSKKTELKVGNIFPGDPEKYQIEKKIESINVIDLATKLIMAYQNNEINLLLYYHWLMTHVYDVKKDNAQCILVFKKTFIKEQCKGNQNLINFRESFISSIKETDLWKTVIVETTFEKDKIVEKKFDENEGISLPVTDELIDDFFAKFVLAVHQPNEEKLKEIIANEVGAYMNLIDGESCIYSKFFDLMVDWVKAKEGRWLTSEDAKNLFENLKQELASFGLMGLSLEYKLNISKNGYRFDNDVEVIKKVRAFLEKDEKTKKRKERTQILIIYYKYHLLSAMKILQAHPGTKADEDIFCDLKTLINLENTTTCPKLAFTAKKSNYLVVDNITKLSRCTRLLRKFIEVISKNRDKCIILNISLDEEKDVEKFLNTTNDLFVYESLVDKEYNIDNLSKDEVLSKENLLNQSEIIFQGEKMKSHHIFNENNSNLIHGEILLKLMSKDEIQIGKSTIDKNYKEIEKYIVQRTLQRCVTIKDDILQSKAFIVYDSTKAEINKVIEFPDSEIILISDDETKFRELKTNHNGIIHWLTKSDNYIYNLYDSSLENQLDFNDWNKIHSIFLHENNFPESELETSSVVVVIYDELAPVEDERIKFHNQVKQYARLILESSSEKSDKVLANIKTIFVLSRNELTEHTFKSSKVEVKVVLVLTNNIGDMFKDEDLFKSCNGRIKYVILPQNTTTLLWKKSKGKISNLRKYMNKSNDKYDYQLNYELEETMNLSNKVAIISAEPGMGKSILLTNMALKIQEDTRSNLQWVVKVNLVDYWHKLNKLAKKSQETDVIQFLCSALKLEGLEDCNGEKKEMKDFVGVRTKGELFLEVDKNKIKIKEVDLLEVRLFMHYYNSGNVIVFLDGFDDMSKDYNKALDLIKELKLTKIKKIWVTTRPYYHLLSDLENQFDTIAYGIAPLSKSQQRDFLTNFLQNKVSTMENIETVINTVLDNFAEELNRGNLNNLTDFLGIPLHLTMMATLVENKFTKTSLNERISDFSHKFNLYDLYKKFVEIKLDFICKPAEGEKSMIYNILEEGKEKILVYHRYFALLELFSEETIPSFISDDELVIIKGKLKLIEKAEEQTGLVFSVCDGRPQFVNRTFAEYFAADFLASAMENNNEKALTLLYKIWTKEHLNHTVLLNFLNYNLISNCVDEGHKYVLTVALNKSKSLGTLNNYNDNILDSYGRTPLHLACHNFNLDLWMKRKETGLSVKDKIFEWTPLHYVAASAEDIQEIEIREDSEEDSICTFIDSQDKKGKTPIMLALELGHERKTRFLLEFKPNLNIEDKCGHTAIHYATNDKCCLHLIAYGANLDRDLSLNFDNADHEYITAVVRIISKYVIDKNDHIIDFIIKLTNDFKVMLLSKIAAWSPDAFCELSKIVSVVIKDSKGKTLIHYFENLVNFSNLDIIIEKMKKIEADAVNIKDNEGKTALHYVAHKCNKRLVDSLLRVGANPTIRDLEENTPLQYALDDEAKVLCLLRGGAYYDDVKPKDLSANSILKEVQDLFTNVSEKNLEIVEFILVNCKEKDIVINSKSTDSGKTPLDIAVDESYGDGNIVDCLLSHGAYRFSSEHKNRDVDDELFDAVANGIIIDIETCISKGAKVNCINYRSGMQPLHLAIQLGYLKVTKLLIEKKAFVEGRVAENRTILHIAVENDRTDVLEYLLGLDKINTLINAKDACGYTALCITKNEKIKNMLKNKGAENGFDYDVVPFQYYYDNLQIALEHFGKIDTKIEEA